jgi:hypothetical protein
MRIIQMLLMFAILFPSSVLAGITEGGMGMLFGADHAFNFTAPKGWVLDNQSGVQQGLYMIFYPADQTWSNSPVIAYGRSVPKASDLRSIEDQVKRTVDEFHNDGSLNYKAQAKDKIVLPNGKTFYIYFFQGDKWGNYEAAGYINESETINFLVYNARTKVDFEKNLPAFRTIISTYRNVFENTMAKNEAKFNSLIAEAKALENTKEGKKYSADVIQAFGNSLASIMKLCTAYTTKSDPTNFDLLFKIKSDGTVSEAFIRPTNGLTSCVRGLVLDTKHAPHKLDPFLMHIEMSVKE